MFRDGIRVLVHVSRENLLRGLLHKRRMAGQHLVGENTHRVDIRPVVDVWIRGGLFRTHVGRRPQRDSHRRQRRLSAFTRSTDRLSHAKIRDHGMPLAEQHVIRFDVAMDHVVAMRIRQRVDHFAQDLQGLGNGQLALAGQLLAERFALDVRHDVPEQIVGRARRQELDHMRMLERRREFDLALEALLVDPGGHVGGQDLYHHLPAEFYLLGQKHLGHATAAEFTLESIGILAEGGLETVEEVRHQRFDFALEGRRRQGRCRAIGANGVFRTCFNNSPRSRDESTRQRSAV